MNAQLFQRIRPCKYLYCTKVRSAHQFKTEIEATEILPKQEAKVSQIGNGIKVASIEDNSPVSQIAVVIKAGSRYETQDNLGVVHALRNAAVLTTKNHTAFSLIRNLEVRGAKLSVVGTRDYLFYTLKCPRDEVDSSLEILSGVTNKQLFKPWEVNDGLSKLQVDLAMLNNNPSAVLNELLHKAAFRGGLSNGIYSPTWMIGKHSSEMLHNYVHDNFTTSRTSVVALGVPHEHLQNSVNELFDMPSGSANITGASKFAPGEIRHEADLPLVQVAIVAEGSGLSNIKDTLSLGILSAILGFDSDIPNFTKLGAVAAKSSSNPVHVNTLNISYAETGLFGVYIVGSPDEMNAIVKAVVSEMRQAAKTISSEALAIAKHKLKAKLLIERDVSSNALNCMAIETAEYGQIKNVDEILKSIDALKLADVQAVAGRVMKAKPAMAALGRLHATPHFDELM